MLVFLYGKDTYRSSRKLREIILHYQELKQETIHLRVIDCQGAVFSTLETELQTNSLFQTKKLLVLKNLFSNKELLEDVKKWKKFLQATSDTVVFFEQGQVASGDSFARFLKEHAKTQEFAPLSLPSLKIWIEKEFLAYKVAFLPALVDKLMRVCHNDLWALEQEIQKLSAFAKSADSPLDLGNTSLLLKEPLETDIFLTINTLKRGDKRKALEFLASHIEKGESPFYLISMLSWGVRSLAKASALPKEKIAHMHENIFETDLAMKTGKMEGSIALFSLAAKL